MSWKRSIPIGVGVFVCVVAAVVVGSAMLLTDKGEEMVHLYRDYRTASGKTPGAPMELQGTWRGMTLVPLGGPTAKALGVPEQEKGVVVAKLPEGSPARRNGLMPGDVLVGLDNTQVRDLSDVYSFSRSTGWAAPVVLDVQRHGQAMNVFLPGDPVPPGVVQPGAEAPEWPAATPGATPGLTPGTAPAGVQANWGGSQRFYCPMHGVVPPGPGPGGGYVCPRCRGPLHLYQPFQPPVR